MSGSSQEKRGVQEREQDEEKSQHHCPQTTSEADDKIHLVAPPSAAAAQAVPTLSHPTLFVGNLHPKIARIHLEKLLDKFGTIERIHIVTAKGFAFCEFSRSSQAQAAMRQLHGRILLDDFLLPAGQRSEIDLRPYAQGQYILLLQDAAGRPLQSYKIIKSL